jgi:hypothetical protein
MNHMKSSVPSFRLLLVQLPSLQIRQLVLLAGACAALQSCQRSPTAPPPVFVEAQLDRIWIEPSYSAFQDAGVLVVMGAPTDTAFRLPENARLRVEIETSGGDSEDFAFQRKICSPGDRDCTGLSIVMKDGHHANELRAAFDGRIARLYSVSVSGRFAGIRVFDIRSLNPTMDMLSKNSTIESVSPHGFGVIIGGPSLAYSHVLASLPLDYQAPRQRDGVIQSGSGQTITVRYEQPDGTSLVLSEVLPATVRADRGRAVTATSDHHGPTR